jgi:hypothetical protein
MTDPGEVGVVIPNDSEVRWHIEVLVRSKLVQKISADEETDVGAAGTRQLMAGMVGGGVGADIGKTHRFAMRLDDRYVLTAGIFSQNEESSAQLGASLGITEDRLSVGYGEMAEQEAARPDGIEVVVVATPNKQSLRHRQRVPQIGNFGRM